MNGEARVDARPWIADGDGDYRCKKHDEWFKTPATCTKCETDPATVTLHEPPPELAAPPKGCKSSIQLERRLIAIAAAAQKDVERLSKQARELANQVHFDGSAVTGKPKAKPKKNPTFDFHLERNITGHRELELKALRAAAQLALQREDAELVREREKRILGAAAAGAEH